MQSSSRRRRSGERNTNLYIALAARTSIYAKSTTANIAMDVLKRAGLDYLMAALDRGAYVSLDGIGSGYWTDWVGAYDMNIDWISQFVDAGYEPGDRVAIAMPMTVDAVVAYLGTIAAGVAKALGWSRARVAAVCLVVLLPNSGNYGLSACRFAFGEEGLAHAGIYFVASSILTFTPPTGFLSGTMAYFPSNFLRRSA